MTGPAPRRALRLVPDEPDQVFRLARFRQDHPGVVIGDAGFGAWEARIPDQPGKQSPSGTPSANCSTGSTS